MKPSAVASYTVVEVTRKDAAGNVVERGWVLDPRERSARIAREEVARAWAKLPPNAHTVEAVCNLLVDQFGFMRAAKIIPVEVVAGVRQDVAPSAPSDATWNWKGVRV